MAASKPKPKRKAPAKKRRETKAQKEARLAREALKAKKEKLRVVEYVLGEMMMGRMLRHIFAEDGDHENLCSRQTFYNWVNAKEEKGEGGLFDRYARAREIQLAEMFESQWDHADNDSRDLVEVTKTDKKGEQFTTMITNNVAVQRDKLRVDTLDRHTARMNPGKYGLVNKHRIGGDADAPPIQTEDVTDELNTTKLARQIAYLLTEGQEQ